jgi:hypothetical protein
MPGLETEQSRALYSHVLRRMETATERQRASIPEYTLGPTGRQTSALDLTLALLSAAQNDSPTPEERRTMTENNQTACRLGIMLPRDPDSPAETMSISYGNTPEQIEGRDNLLQLLSVEPFVEFGHPGLVPLATRLYLPEQRSAIVGRGTPRLRDYADHLRQARTALSGTQRGNSTDEVAWDRSEVVDENGDPYTVAGIFRHLRALTHNTIYVAMVS